MIVGAHESVVGASGSFGLRRITAANFTAKICRAFVAVVRAGAASNRDVSAFPVQANIVRAEVTIVVAELNIRIGIMGA